MDLGRFRFYGETRACGYSCSTKAGKPVASQFGNEIGVEMNRWLFSAKLIVISSLHVFNCYSQVNFTISTASGVM
jgi:hypothetical protein